jgi:hypothetical protein
MPSSGGSRRVRVERGIYRQENGRYAVCVMVERRPRFRTIDAGSLSEARVQRELLQSLACVGELPVSPRLTFAEVAARSLAEFEARVGAGERRDRTFDLGPRTPSQRRCLLDQNLTNEIRQQARRRV